MFKKIKVMILEIMRGDDYRHYRESAVPRVLRAEEGLMTWATLVAVVLFCTLIAMVFNVGRIANDRLEAQNAADSAAYSASLVQARAMNAVTTANHMMGELTALYTMHHAIGGKVLDDGGSKYNWVVGILNAGIYASYAVSLADSLTVIWWPGTSTPEYFGNCDDAPQGEATVYDSKCILKEKLIEQYIAHAAGTTDVQEGIATVWFFGAGAGLIASGIAQQRAANLEIREIKREYEFIRSLERFAKSTLFVKKSIPYVLDGLWTYERMIAGGLVPGIGVQWKCKEAASLSAEKNMCVGEVVGRPSVRNIALAQAGLPTATIPLVQDPTRDKERTQLMRATYPWIQEWRSPLIGGFYLLVPRSRATVYYEYHSDQYARDICDKFRRERGYKLYVMEEMNASTTAKDKGTETWRLRNNSSKADEMFCVVGLARKKDAPANSHLAFLPNTNPTPVTAMSQAMIYNGNRPTKWEMEGLDYMYFLLGREGQPVEGWDTLNWTEGATEWKDGKPYFNWLPDDLLWIFGRFQFFDVPFVYPPDIKFPPIPGVPTLAGPPTPKVRLNWQSKLVPIATKNLAKRMLMVQDTEIGKRMRQQVLPAILSQQLGADVIHH